MTNNNTLAASGEDSYKDEPVPEFGRGLLKYWTFEPDTINLNNGSFGAPPRPVLEACAGFDAQSQANSDRFFRFTHKTALLGVQERLSKFLSVATDEVVLVPSATHALNTVLRNFEWKAGDVLIDMNVTYGAVARTMRYLCDTNPHLTISSIDIEAPTTHAEIVEAFHSRVLAIKGASSFTQHSKIVAVIDAITSNPGLYMPWQRIVQLCREEGAWSVVDAAHAIGQEIDINLSEVRPDFWFSNCHKWLYAKRGSAVLYVPKRNQHMIKSSLPTGWGYVIPEDLDFPDSSAPAFGAQFQLTGQYESIPYFGIPAALDFREWLGGETKINAYTRSLALTGGKLVAEMLGTSLLDQTDNSELTLNMVNVKLPLPDTLDRPTRWKIFEVFNEKSLSDWKCYMPVFYFSGAWWARLSAQVWNEISDFEHAGRGLTAICKAVLETIIDEKGDPREHSA